MTFEAKAKRKNALAVADALNKIEGVPVSDYAASCQEIGQTEKSPEPK